MTPADDSADSPGVRESSTRARIEDRVATLGVVCFHSPLRTLGIFFLIVAALGSQLPKTHFETDVELHLASDNPVRLNYEFLREQFGRSDFAMVVMTPPEVFTPEFLTTLRDLHERFEDELPWIDEVQSLVNARFTRGEDDTLVVGDLNHEPDTVEHRRWLKGGMLDSFAAKGAGPALTWPADEPTMRIDYVLARGPVADRLEACRVLAEGPFVSRADAPALSDHLPLLASFATRESQASLI